MSKGLITCILGDPGAVSGGERKIRAKKSQVVSPPLTAPGSPRMDYMANFSPATGAEILFRLHNEFQSGLKY